ncbi:MULTISPECIES: hypothetical protein [unclassified Variovorax]|uniref:hypothetical protein n=1 Tax=unclassified Variovorax TaxID=663243 RepID=UPI00076D31DD|nr:MULTISPECIES: hypothetical protein [unclassified Variovorax]KWT98467.1 hypothetical protein APY03_0602 [Variovorax sp. WDL1]PNG49860.1 hypothetical protein CHC06_05441 [Variovorax sp. B2]PNG50732.1 hypothetical protein CHC07_05346 [Variovorax sp. B4]VTU42288.1 hypothetical protein H6P1_00148 [Variovorax sp. PBL-H6]VTU44094.1 hypothetical protein SRS16P1_00754 [Variovorax sp. SRS16]
MQTVFAIAILAVVIASTSVLVTMLIEQVKAERRVAAEKAAKHQRLRTLEMNLRHLEADSKSRKLSQAEMDDYAAFIAERNDLSAALFPQRNPSLAFA